MGEMLTAITAFVAAFMLACSWRVDRSNSPKAPGNICPRCALSERKTGVHPMMIIDDWLEDRISERRFDFEPAADPDEFAMFAGMLRAEALASGYSLDALEKACGGDISAFVSGKMRSQAMPAAHLVSTPAVDAAYAPA